MQTIFEKCPLESSQNFFVWFRGVLICQRGLIPRRTTSCGVSDPAEQSPAGYQTPRNNFFFINTNISGNSKQSSIGDYMGSIRGKNRRSKISCYCPFKLSFLSATDALDWCTFTVQQIQAKQMRNAVKKFWTESVQKTGNKTLVKFQQKNIAL